MRGGLHDDPRQRVIELEIFEGKNLLFALGAFVLQLKVGQDAAEAVGVSANETNGVVEYIKTDDTFEFCVIFQHTRIIIFKI